MGGLCAPAPSGDPQRLCVLAPQKGAAARAIKATAKGQKTPIIAVTAHAFDEERQEILAAGCDDFISKPFDESELFDKLARHLNLQLIYADEGSDTQTAPRNERHEVLPAGVEKIPAETMAALKTAAIRLDIEGAHEVIETIRPRDGSIAEALSRMVETFQFEKIIEMATCTPKHQK